MCSSGAEMGFIFQAVLVSLNFCSNVPICNSISSSLGYNKANIPQGFAESVITMALAGRN